MSRSISFNTESEGKPEAFLAAGEIYDYVVIRVGPIDVSLSCEEAMRLGDKLMRLGMEGIPANSDIDKTLDDIARDS